MDKMLREDGVNTFITRMAGDPAAIAADNNTLQALLEGVGFGIPMTVSTDPRNHFTHDPNATSIGAGAFSQWPETLGLAAIGDAALVQRFGDIARQEYRAVGIHEALSPQADLATEPRWGRINGTFGKTTCSPSLWSRPTSRASQQGARDRQGERGHRGQALRRGRSPEGRAGCPQPLGQGSRSTPAVSLPPPGALRGRLRGQGGRRDALLRHALGLTQDGQPVEEVGFGFNRQIITGSVAGPLQV